MECRELLAWLKEFFNAWNQRHAPADQVTHLQVEMYGQTIGYVFNGRLLCTIRITADQAFKDLLAADPVRAVKQLLLNILETTGDLATSPDLYQVTDRQEREEVIVLLMRLYHDLEADVSRNYPEVRKLFNREYFRKRGRSLTARLKLMRSIECFRDDVNAYFQYWTPAGSQRMRAEEYLAAMSIAELCLLFNAASIITEKRRRWPNVTAAARIVKKLAQ